MSLNIVSREHWKARIPLAHNSIDLPIEYVFCMCTNSLPCYNYSICNFSLRQLQKFHMTFKNMYDIRFSFLIGGDGRVYEGRGWHHAPLLPYTYKPMSHKGLLIGFIGTYLEKNLPVEMVHAREELIKYGIKKNYIKENCQRWQIFRPKSDETEDATKQHK